MVLGKRRTADSAMYVPYPKRTRAYRKAKRRNYTTVARTRGVYAVGEMKYFDVESSSQAIVAATGWAGTELQPNVAVPGKAVPGTFFAPVVGSAINERIGREVKVHKIKIRGIINVAPQTAQSTADTAAIVRLLFVHDTQTNSAQVQGEQVMQPSVTAAAFNNTFTFQNLANFGRFNVKKDKMITLGDPNMAGEIAAGNVVTAGLARPFKMTIKYTKPVSVRFNATNGGTIADIVDNSWTLLGTCSNASLIPTISYQARVCYKE